MGHRDVVKLIIEHISQGNEIACVVPADVVLVSSVSNWGAYALAAGMYMRMCMSASMRMCMCMRMSMSMFICMGTFMVCHAILTI